MLPDFSKIKGLHPSFALKKAMHDKGIKAIELAEALQEHKQTISAILNERRSITPALSVKLADYFKVPEDYFMLLQSSYDVKKVMQTQNSPNLKNFRKVLFWDTDFSKIDWHKNKRAIIRRILERGNEQEIKEILSFYGRKSIKEELKTMEESFLPAFKENIKKYELI